MVTVRSTRPFHSSVGESRSAVPFRSQGSMRLVAGRQLRDCIGKAVDLKRRIVTCDRGLPSLVGYGQPLSVKLDGALRQPPRGTAGGRLRQPQQSSHQLPMVEARRAIELSHERRTLQAKAPLVGAPGGRAPHIQQHPDHQERKAGGNDRQAQRAADRRVGLAGSTADRTFRVRTAGGNLGDLRSRRKRARPTNRQAGPRTSDQALPPIRSRVT